MKRDQYNDTYLDLIEEQRLYFKTVKDFKEVKQKCLQVMLTTSRKVNHIHATTDTQTHTTQGEQ